MPGPCVGGCCGIGGYPPFVCPPGLIGGPRRAKSCAVAVLMVAARSGGICDVALVIVWLRPAGGGPPKMLEKAASRVSGGAGPY